MKRKIILSVCALLLLAGIGITINNAKSIQEAFQRHWIVNIVSDNSYVSLIWEEKR